MSDPEGISDQLLLAEEWLPKSIKAARAAWIHGVTKYVRRSVRELDKEGADQFIGERLGDWRFQKPFVRYFMKFMEEPPGLREQLAAVMGALALTDGEPDFAERLRRVSQLVDDLELDDLGSLRVFAVRYTDNVPSTSEFALRRLEYSFPGVEIARPEDGYRHYRLVCGTDGARSWDYDAVSDWFQLQDRMVDVVVSQLGIRSTGLDSQPAEVPKGGRGAEIARFSSDVDETVGLVRRALELAEIDSLIW